MHIDIEPIMMLRLLLASVLGALIGLEREIHGRPAGFRTHLLVSLGSCLFVISSIRFYTLYGNFGGTLPVGVDPGRVAAQVVAGIGFLGAGAIIREKTSIRGLTTAACLWVAAAIGLACGIGMFGAAIMVTCFALISLLLLKKVENRLSRDTYVEVKVWGEDREGLKDTLEQLMSDCRMNVMRLSLEKDNARQEVCYEFELRFRTRQVACQLVDRIGATEGVRKVRLE